MHTNYSRNFYVVLVLYESSNIPVLPVNISIYILRKENPIQYKHFVVNFSFRKLGFMCLGH